MKNCNTLEELRTEIDIIDDKIANMIGKRNDLIKQASKFKKSVDEIKSDERMETVIDRMRHKAVTMGMSPNMMAEIYTLLIDEMVETEIAEFRNSSTF